ncbi:MAG: GtrA family protein [Chitinophagales bacterium]
MRQNTEASRFRIFVNWIAVFFKAQFSAFVGGISDYIIMIFLTEFAGLFYVISIGISGTLGAVINYSLNRYWTFKRTDISIQTQLKKFVVVVIGSITLKSGGTYILTEWVHIDYKISRLMVDAVVSLGFNFMLQKYWVFRKPSEVQP